MVPPQLFPLDMFDLLERYPGNIVDNSFICAEPMSEYGVCPGNLLIGLVSEANVQPFLKQNATLYYTGKTFPSTVAPTKLFYFMPYIKGKGVRDLYLIKRARVGSKREVQPRAAKEDYRLMFELLFVKQVFKKYHSTDLRLWRTYTDTTLENILQK